MRINVSIDIDTDRLDTCTDEWLASCWHVAQANPAPHADKNAGELVTRIGYEIIKRWLKDAPATVYHHCPTHHYHKILTDHGNWPGPKHDKWVPFPHDASGRPCPECAIHRRCERHERPLDKAEA